MFWPFSRKRKDSIKKPGRIARKVVVGLIIGGAIGSIVGKKLLEKHGAKDEEKDDDDNGFEQRDV